MNQERHNGTEYFAAKFGYLADLALIPSLQGTGSVTQNGTKKFNCDWELIQLVDGFHELRLRIEDLFRIEQPVKGYSPELIFEGRTSDEKFWLKSNTLIVYG